MTMTGPCSSGNGGVFLSLCSMRSSALATLLPSHFTVDVPEAVSDDLAMFGYGMGIGPAGLGVLQTSGKAMVTPPLSLWTTDRLLTPTVTPMTVSRISACGPPSVDVDASAFDL